MSTDPTRPSPTTLDPILQLHPPNQIISRQYTPDIIPFMRLISMQKKNNLHFVAPKRKDKEWEEYMQIFNTFDYSGQYYAKMAGQVVYMKLNNSQYHSLPKQKYKTRVMPSMFVPLAQLTPSSINSFQKQICMDSSQPIQNIQPSLKNNRGCSFDPLFSSSYEGGNLFAAIRTQPFEYQLVLQSDINNCQAHAWFNFAVQFMVEGYYTFRIVNITYDMSQLFQKGFKIAYYPLNSFAQKPKRAQQGWGLCGDNIIFSRSAIEMQQGEGQFYYQLQFDYRCKNKHQKVMFALQTPYGLNEMDRFVQGPLMQKIKGMMMVQRRDYGKSFADNILTSYQIKRKRNRNTSFQLNNSKSEPFVIYNRYQKHRTVNLSPLNSNASIQDTRNRSVIVLGRESGLDINSDYLIQGMMEFLIDSIEFDSLKKTIDFHFFPMINPDCVKYGSNKATLTGSLLDRNWRNPDKIYQPQLTHLKEYLKEINKDTPICLILNLTSQHQKIVTTVYGVSNQNKQTEDSRIFPYIMSKRHKMFSYQESIFMNKGENGSFCCVMNQLFPKASVYQFNVSRFHEVPNEELPIQQCSAQTYRLYGKDILSSYLQHIKLYDKNNMLKDKWMRQIAQTDSSILLNKMTHTLQPKIEERFPLQHYSLPISQILAPSISSGNSIQTGSLGTNMQIGSICNTAKLYQHGKAGMRMPVKNPSISGLRTNNSKTTLEQNSEPAPYQSQPQIQKPRLFRIAQKKTSILKHCLPNFTIDGVKESQPSRKEKRRDSAQVERDMLKKELSTKMMRRVKIEDTIKERRRSRELRMLQHGNFLSP